MKYLSYKLFCWHITRRTDLTALQNTAIWWQLQITTARSKVYIITFTSDRIPRWHVLKSLKPLKVLEIQ